MAKRNNSSWCGAINCNNSKQHKPELSFHRIPKDPALSRQWIQSCRRADLLNKTPEYLNLNVKICSRHFEASQFFPNSKRLLRNAVPMLFDVPNPPKPIAIKRRLCERRDLAPKKAKQERRNFNKKRAEHEEGKEEKAPEDQLLADRERELKTEAATAEEMIKSEQDGSSVEGQIPAQDDATAGDDDTSGPPKPYRFIASAPSDHNTAVAAATFGSLEPDQEQLQVHNVCGNSTIATKAAASTDVSPADLSDEGDQPPPGDDGAGLDGSSDGGAAALTAAVLPRDKPSEASRTSVSVPRGGSDSPSVQTYLKNKALQLQIALVATAPQPFPVPAGAPMGVVPNLPQNVSKGPSSVLCRAKEILYLKTTMRKWENKCCSVLTKSGSQPQVTRGQEAARTKGPGDWTKAMSAKTAMADAAAGTARKTPLMVLRDKRRRKLPSIVVKMRQHELSNSVAMYMPTDLQRALEVNHKLKVQLLKMQTTMLQWAIKSKRLHDLALKEAGQKLDRTKKKTVSNARLRELLQLETSVKSRFSVAQLRVITREHGRSTDSDPSDAKHMGTPQWGEEDVRHMLELRAISSDRVVDHVREKMKIPLPTMFYVKNRCRKYPERNQAYKAMISESKDRRKRCDCHLNTIDRVIEAVVKEVPEDDDTPCDRPFQQQPVTSSPRGLREEQPAAAMSRPKKPRRRAPAAAPPLARRKTGPVSVSVVSRSRDWPQTSSDSEAEMSDPGIGGARLADYGIEWEPGESPSWKRPRPGPMRAWR